MTDSLNLNQHLNNEHLVHEKAKLAWQAAPALAGASLDQRNRAIHSFKEILHQNRQAILDANQADASAMQLSAAQFKNGRMSIDNTKIDTLLSGFEALAAMDDPIGAIDLARQLDDELNLYRVTCPIGVIGIIFEARPDVLPQIAALTLKSGNAVLLKGGREVEQTNKILFNCLQDALMRSALPTTGAALLESRADVVEMLKADRYIDLIIPRGSNQLVTYIQSNTRIPVLGHAEGICHVYVHHSADLKKALNVVVDAKVDYPSACNSAEVLLLDQALDETSKLAILKALADQDVDLRLSPILLELLRNDSANTIATHKIQPAQAEDFDCEWGSLVISVKEVTGVGEAIEHVNEHSSGHTDSIVCEDQSAWDLFFGQVRSAGVYRNASTRFADGYRYGFGAEVGISTSKLPPRGPVGLEGLTTYKYKLEGQGHAVGDYSRGTRSFTHKTLPLE